jgi:hypothetical protein
MYNSRSGESVCNKGDHFLFGLIFIKKIIKPNFFKKTKIELKPDQTDPFQFGSIRFFK